MANDLARWQFATTSVYHFFFVPVTIGLAFLVAILQTAWYRTDNPDYKRMTRFFGTLLLINVAVGVVTGLVQEFEFGMNWSTYSRFVGGVFGAPLAMEGLARSSWSRPFSDCGCSGGTGFPSAFTWPASGSCRSGRCCRRCSSSWPTRGCSTPSATRSTRPGQRGTDQRLGAVHQPDVPVGLRARDPGVARHRVPGDARRVGVVPAPAASTSMCAFHRTAQGRADRADPRDRDPAVGRQQAR